MDFVDLDKVLDEFEEEEKAALSIVPGQELKPSGYIEFLEKHEEQDWANIHGHKFSSSSSGYTLERRAAKQPANVSYDDPYDSFSHSKLGFIQDHPSDLHFSQNGISSLSESKVSIGESSIGANVLKLKVKESDVSESANNSSRQGTIASQSTEVQTDILSPASEQELMSYPLPKSDIIVEGHGDTSVSAEDEKGESEPNHSPVYASLDAGNIVPNSTDESAFSPSTAMEASFVHENNTSVTALNSGVHTQMSLDAAGVNRHSFEPGSASAQTVGFEDTVDKELDDDDVDMYLNELDEGVVDALNSVNMSKQGGFGFSDIQSEVAASKGSQERSLADELVEAEPNRNCSPPKWSLSEENQKSLAVCDTYSHTQDPDIVADLGGKNRDLEASQKENEVNVDENGLIRKTQHTEAILSEKSTISYSDVYNSLVKGKMEIECVLDERKAESRQFDSVLEKLSQTTEIEKIIDEVVKNQRDLPQDAEIKSDPSAFGHSQTNMSEQCEAGSFTGKSEKSLMSGESISPAHSVSSSSDTGSPILSTGIGARPKDPSAIKKNRPNSLLGLSKVNFNSDISSSIVRSLGEGHHGSQSESPQQAYAHPNVSSDAVLRSPQHQPDRDSLTSANAQHTGAGLLIDQINIPEQRQRMDANSDKAQDGAGTQELPASSTQEAQREEQGLSSEVTGAQDGSADSLAANHRMKRPTTLNLPARPEIALAQSCIEDDDMEPNDQSAPTANTAEDSGSAVGGAADHQNGNEECATTPVIQSDLGNVAPFWIPDADAPACMLCQAKFTMWKRRHHCRACGKVLCSVCCNQKAYLAYMDSKEARVCQECHIQLTTALGSGVPPRSPNPNNPNEYCSKVPPTQQASGQANIPVVMVPTGVLKTSGSQRKSGEPKQVMFSDGIRPGGDLTELDGPDQSRSHRRSNRAARRAAQNQNQPPGKKNKEESLLRSHCLIPEEGLPPLFVVQGNKGYIERDEALNQIDYTSDYKSEGGATISYAVNENLSVSVKIISLDCCVNRVCWCFVTRGMDTAGQSELVILLELTEEEATSESLKPPRDIFLHFNYVYEETLKGNAVEHMGHTIFSQNFLENREHGGFLYLRPTFQCLNKLPLPEAPYLFGVLLQKWEAPWAKVFPIRLMLRLGAEFRYYPCPLVGIRNRKPVFFEIGHTIMNLLADFRNYQYVLTQIPGVTIHMEDKKTTVSFPRNRYNDVMKVVRSSNEHVMALGSSFSMDADSHLVCIQNEDGNYQTQAINIQNKPRLVTGASFVVFNGALKSSTGLKAKSSIVEDGLMVQVLPETMVGLKQALKDMSDHTIACGPVDVEEPEEVVVLKWVDNDRNFNIGVKSVIDGMSLEGMESVIVKSPTDVTGETLAVRWTRVYFLEQDSSSSSHFDPVDLSRLTEEIAHACCTALVKHLEELKQEGQVKLGLRVNLSRESVGYEVGSLGKPLPSAMMNNLDTFLVPIVHQAAEEGIIMELVFNIVD